MALEMLAEYLGVVVIDGIPMHCWSDGVRIPIVSGGDGEGDEGSGDDDDDDTSGDGDESGDDDDDTSGDDDIKDPKAKLAAESEKNKRLTSKLNKNNTELEELRKWKREKESEGQTELDKVKTERDELKTVNDELSTNLNRRAAQVAILMSPEAKRFRSTKVIDRVIDYSEAEFDDDGNVTNIKDLLDDVAQNYPELLAPVNDDDEDDDEPKNKKNKGPSGDPMNRGKNKGGPDREALIKKYPALQR